MMRDRWTDRLGRSVAALLIAAVAITPSPTILAKSPDANPQLVLSTGNDGVLITLARDAAPLHVAAMLDAVDAGAAARWSVDRVAAAFYVQLGSPDATAISGLAPEPIGVGNVRGAVSIFDGAGAVPTIVIVLTDSHQLDDRYTPIGWVESGLDAIESISQAPADSEGIPVTPSSIGPLRRLGSGPAPELTTGGETALPGAAIVMMLLAAAATGSVALVHRRLPPAVVTTLLLATTLIAFFSVWTAAIGRTAGRPVAAVSLFVALIGVFRLMGRFEQPRAQAEVQGARRSMIQPGPDAPAR